MPVGLLSSNCLQRPSTKLLFDSHASSSKNEPLTTKELVGICNKELNWKRTTTYTILKKLCERGIFKTENSTVTSIISKNEFYAIQREKFVDETFQGSLPAFIAAFTTRKKTTAKELEEIKKMIDSFGEV